MLPTGWQVYLYAEHLPLVMYWTTDEMIILHLKYFIQEKVKCDQCDKSFAHVYSLNKHKKFIHTGVKLKCELCEYVTAKPYDLKIHKQRMHEVG